MVSGAAQSAFKTAPKNGLKIEDTRQKAIHSVIQGARVLNRSLIPKWLPTNRPRWPAHITVVREEKERPTKTEAWGKYDGHAIKFWYSPFTHSGKVYYWLNAFSSQLEDIRVELGLPVKLRSNQESITPSILIAGAIFKKLRRKAMAMRKKAKEDWHNFDFSDDRRMGQLNAFAIWSPAVVYRFAEFGRERLKSEIGIRFKIGAVAKRLNRENHCVVQTKWNGYNYPNVSPHTKKFDSCHRL